ncbi:conserved hypothetical protein [Planktothrix tepida PCC 9214]|uniref:Uncharacterized protein n=1 Tax=Planktothrix tepida PCC 9214 TaxID=671072 RepID=A0A1J1LP55_9CYAN|nr:conserved hypothetical protein [Planktothrix tepida PCC 9214]
MFQSLKGIIADFNLPNSMEQKTMFLFQSLKGIIADFNHHLNSLKASDLEDHLVSIPERDYS